MLDPYQDRFGLYMGAFLFLPHVLTDILFGAATLLSLGSTVSVILGLDLTLSTIASEIVVVTYTLFGGLRSVAYTDVVQLPCVLIGLVSFSMFIFSEQYQ